MRRDTILGAAVGLALGIAASALAADPPPVVCPPGCVAALTPEAQALIDEARAAIEAARK